VSGIWRQSLRRRWPPRLEILDNAKVERVVVLGRGGAGKTTFAHRLGSHAGLPVVTLDDHFWRPGLKPLSFNEWATVQRRLASEDRWIMDGDLGPYDVLPIRLARADTVLMLDFNLLRCAWQAHRRSRESWDFWRWVVSYRRHHRPRVVAAVATYAPQATFTVLRHPRALADFFHELAGNSE